MKTTNYTSYSLYSIALLFAALSIFLQLLPLSTSQHFEDTLSLSTTGVVNLTSLFFVTYAIMQIPGGILLDKYGVRYILPIGLFSTIIGCYLYWHCNNGFTLGFGRLISGFGCSIAYITGIFIAATFFPSARLPLFIGVLEAGSTIGSLVAARPLETSMHQLGWSTTGNLVIGFTVLLFLASIFFSRGIKDSTVSNLSFNDALKQTYTLLKNKKLIPLFIYSWATWFVIMSFAGYWLKDYLIELHKYSQVEALQIIEIYWTSFLISSIFISHFVQNIKTAKLTVFTLAAIGFVTFALMAIPLVFNLMLVVLVVLFAGLSAVGVIIAFSLIPNIVSQKQCGSAIAINNTFVVFGGYSGQVVFGWVVKHINISEYISAINPEYLEPHYYAALLIYPLITGIALFSIIKATR